MMTVALMIDLSGFAGNLEGQSFTGFKRKSGRFVHLEEMSEGLNR